MRPVEHDTCTMYYVHHTCMYDGHSACIMSTGLMFPCHEWSEGAKPPQGNKGGERAQAFQFPSRLTLPLQNESLNILLVNFVQGCRIVHVPIENLTNHWLLITDPFETNP